MTHRMPLGRNGAAGLTAAPPIMGRAAFWPATWAMASELPGSRGVQLGRLNAVTNLGQIGGTALCGFLLAAAGFDVTFATFAAIGFVSFLAGLGTQPRAAKAVHATH